MDRITITTFADARDAFRHRDLRQALYDAGHRLMTGVIVNLHGDAHVARRRLENRLFRRDTFAWYERERIPSIIDQVLAPVIVEGHGDLLALARRTMLILSIDIAGIDATSDDATSDDARFSEFQQIMEDLARASTVAHSIGGHEAIIERGEAALDRFEQRWFRPSCERRRALIARYRAGEITDDALPRDVLTTLLLNQDDLDLPPAHLLREIAYFPWVGSHSTSGQLVHAVHHIFDRITAEPPVRARIARDASLCQRFVHESMRLHPASPVALRIATDDLELRSGRRITAGTEVTIDLVRANQDPDVFGPDADRFDPDRVIPDGVHRFGLSFGHGAHACLGRELAGGLEPDEAHLLGSVTLMAASMLRAGARPDPTDPPALDTSTTRTVWARYPVLFSGSGTVPT